MIRSWFSLSLKKFQLKMERIFANRFSEIHFLSARRKCCLVGVVLISSTSYCMSAEIEYLDVSYGPKVIHIQVDTASSIALQAYWSIQWHFDSELNPMVPATATQALFTGTARGMTISDLGQKLENLRVQRSLTTTSDAVIGSVVAPVSNFEEVIQLLNMVLVNPEFDSEHIGRIKQGIQSHIQNLRLGTDSIAWELARNLMMQDNPVKRYFSTSTENEFFLESVSLSEIEMFYDQAITKKSATIVVSTPFDSDQVAKLVEELFDGIPLGHSVDVPQSDIVFPAGRTVVLYDSDVERSYIAFAGILPPVSSGGEFEDLIALILFGQGANSELYEALRAELGDGYEFTTNTLPLTSDLRILQIAGMVDTDKLSFTHQAIRQLYEDFRANGPQSSLISLKRRLVANLRTNIENPAVLVPLVMENVVNGFPASRALEHVGEIEAITPDVIRERLQVAFPPAEQLLTVVVTSDPDLIPNACVIDNVQAYRECL